MKKLLLSLLISLLPLGAQENAHEILDATRYVSTLNKTDLTGKLRKDSTSVPVTLYMREENIQMQYKPDPNGDYKGVHLKLANDSCELYDLKDGGMTKFPDSKIGESIAGTDLTYEDLSLRFLYWPDPEIKGEEKLLLTQQDCYIIRVFNPDRRGNYSVCDLWIHKKAAALMQVEAYNWKAKHVKTFKVSELMQVDGDYAMKKMKVETIKDGRTASISYLIFDEPEKKKESYGNRKLR